MTDHPDEAAALLDFLRLQIDWGADEALLDEPVDRRAPTAAAPAAAADRRPAAADRGHAPVVAVERARPPPRTVPEPAFRGGHGAAEAARLAAAAPDLVALAAAVAAFSLSSLRDTAGALAFADGPARARLMVVADAPSAADDESGRPLSGREGDLLDRMLGSIGIARADTRVGCLVPWRPPGDRPPTATEIATLLPFLEAHLRLASPATLLLLGTATARAVAGASGTMRALAGSWHEVTVAGAPAAIPALILPPPATLLREPRLKRIAWSGLLSLAVRLEAIA